MKKVFLLLLLFPTIALAENSNSSLNLQLPNAGTTYGQDSFSSDGMDCKNSIGGGTNLEFGVTGIIDDYESPLGLGSSSGSSTKDIGVYARITIPLDGPKERINCNTLYELELKKKRLEILQLEQELIRLQQLQESSE